MITPGDLLFSAMYGVKEQFFGFWQKVPYQLCKDGLIDSWPVEFALVNFSLSHVPDYYFTSIHSLVTGQWSCRVVYGCAIFYKLKHIVQAYIYIHSV